MGKFAFLIGVCAVLLGSPADAQTKVSIDRRDCARLVRYVAPPDVAYKPGVDAHGRKVVPADIGGGPQIVLPDRFEIPITIDLGARLGIPVNGDADYIARFPVGVVSVDGDGRIAFDGVPLNDESAAELAALCQRRETGD